MEEREQKLAAFVGWAPGEKITMLKSEYLDGRVVKWSLPAIHGRPGPDAPLLKRLLLPQGELAQIYDSDEGIRYLAAVETRLGGDRGRHYHKVKEEWIYVLQGKVTVIVQDIQTDARASATLETGDLLFIPAGIAHLMRTIEPGQAIEFSKTRFNAADTFPFAMG